MTYRKPLPLVLFCALACGSAGYQGDDPSDPADSADPGLETETDGGCLTSTGPDGLLPEETTSRAGGEAADDAPGCARLAAIQPNPNPSDPDSWRWIALDVSKCGPSPADRLVQFETEGGLVIELAAIADPTANCAVAIDDLYQDLVFEDHWTASVWFSGLPESVTHSQAFGEEGPSTGLTWAVGADDLFVPGLPSLPPSADEINGGCDLWGFPTL